ncbi:hypothetical protein FDI40_gp283 [Agrobacterium phage Atu_ph07]|uniref:Uncharacterized protein n=1 Tax=Agrobacterium phage Atu_ph07 TaxID=2024264 RepID=A0A2L0UZV4_9CAUD|nr:hypothetical protein FDI40_gp283 [Agrobacterium phage Atu_ph07]AUZ95055.1 hypothetical protein [Agrobacterium phage Atu_ph07]
MRPGRIVKYLTNTKDRTLQEQIVNDAWTKCSIFFVGLDLSSNDAIPKVSKIPAITPDGSDPTEWDFDDFLTLFDTVTQIDIEEDEAKTLVREAAMQAPDEDWNLFYRKILQKKLHEEVPMDVITSVLKKLTGHGF